MTSTISLAKPTAKRLVSQSHLGLIPPNNLEAEESLVGAMLLSQDAINIAIGTLRPGDFYSPRLGTIFASIVSLYERQSPSDSITLADELERSNQLDSCGGRSYLSSLTARSYAISNAGEYAKIVKDHSILRQLASIGADIQSLAYSLPLDVSEAIELTQRKVFELASSKQTGEIYDGPLLASLAEISQREAQENPGALRGLSSGWDDVDRLVRGLREKELLIVGGRPSMGKTSFVLGLARHVVLSLGESVLFFSLEMSATEIAVRLVSAMCRIDPIKMEAGRLSQTEIAEWDKAAKKLASSKLIVIDVSDLTPAQMRTIARKEKAKRGCGLVILDYIQLMGSGGVHDNENERIADVSRQAKAIAKELSVPVVAVAQLNRGLEQRSDKRPQLSDLRGSGQLEQDADKVLFLYRDDVYNTDSTQGATTEVIVAKNRNGQTGTAHLSWQAHLASHASIARYLE